MDTSEEYIKMCRAATEIQEGWYPKQIRWDGTTYKWRGDIAAGEDTLGKLIIGPVCEAYKRDGKNLEIYIGTSDTNFSVKNTVWIPRIDQLHVMCVDSWSEFYFEISDTEYGLKDYTKFPTAEQAGLACVMWWNYKKEWDGEKWS